MSLAASRLTRFLARSRKRRSRAAESFRMWESPAQQPSLVKGKASMSSTNSSGDLQAVEQLSRAYQTMAAELGKIIVGQQEVVEQVLTAMFCQGHVLLVGVPGLAKTLLVRTISDVLHLSFKRIQFTPDLMPSDITGTDVLEEDHTTGKRIFRFVRGPLLPIWSWPTKSTVRLPKRRQRCSKRCRSARSQAMARAAR